VSTYQFLPPLTADEFASLRESIETFGVLQPVIVDEDGNILDGHHRAQVCAELGIAYDTVVLPGLTEEQKIEQALALNLGRRHLDAEQKQALVADLRARGLSVRFIAENTGIPKSTVQRYGSGVPDGTPGYVTGRDGKTYRALRPVDQATALDIPRSTALDGDEWYTPRWLFDALGVRFDLDVCAPIDRTHASVPTQQWYTTEDDGLVQPWHGFVWCNPPYSNATPWAERMIDHGNGILLSHVPINGLWCLRTWTDCSALRLLQGVEFVRPDGRLQRPGYWLQLAAFGAAAREALVNLDSDDAVRERYRPSPAFVPVAGRLAEVAT
jgi:hypothetical protein